MDKNTAISALIISERLNGKSMREAFDAVLGVGQYDKLVNDLYHELRAKSAK